jgi:hypothetical protein
MWYNATEGNSPFLLVVQKITRVAVVLGIVENNLNAFT